MENLVRKFPVCCGAAAVMIILMLSCSKRDDRNDIRARYGEPDVKQAMGKEIFWSERWFYNASGVGYEFRRNAGCGSYHDVYLYGSFYFTPDTSGQTTSQNPKPDPNVQPNIESRDGVLMPY